jgi:hypothetical protein
MIREVEEARPKYLIFVQIPESWLARPGSAKRLVSWVNRYARACFDRVGIAEIVSRKLSRIAWDDEIVGFKPVSPDVIYVFRRKSDAPCSVR